MSSIIWKVSTDEFRRLVKRSSTYKDILTSLGRDWKSGGGYITLKQRIVEEGVDVSHIEAGKKTYRGGRTPKRSLKEVLVNGVEYRNLKSRLIRDRLIPNECVKCRLKSRWCGEPIVLQLDHINGKNKDNRLENLRLLCPNCHSQTPTFGKRNATTLLESDFCKCGARKARRSSVCKKCSKPSRFEKIKWPQKEKLQKLLLEKPTSLIAKELGVSDSAIGKRARKLGLKKPKRGHWGRGYKFGAGSR